MPDLPVGLAGQTYGEEGMLGLPTGLQAGLPCMGGLIGMGDLPKIDGLKKFDALERFTQCASEGDGAKDAIL